MAIEYNLILAGNTPLDQITTRALPDPADRPPISGRMFSANLSERYGFGLSAVARQDGYYQAQTDDGQNWEWEPTSYVSIRFRLNKDPARYDDALRHALTVVRRLLTGGSEDAAFMLNGNYLLLTRTNGTIDKHTRTMWWDHYGYPNEIIVG